jgi:hypothetical protein
MTSADIHWPSESVPAATVRYCAEQLRVLEAVRGQVVLPLLCSFV